MADIIAKRFSLSTAHVDGAAWATVILIWLLVLGCAITGIVKQFSTTKQRAIWIAIVVCLPIVGMLMYLPFSFKKEDYPFFSFIKK